MWTSVSDILNPYDATMEMIRNERERAEEDANKN